MLESPTSDDFGVTLVGGDDQQVAIGFGLGGGNQKPRVAKGSQALLAQEIRNPQAGRYVASFEVAGAGIARDDYEQIFLKNFHCRLVIYQYSHRSKTPLKRRELASVEIQPGFKEADSPGFETFKVEKNLTPEKFGMNFNFGLGIGVAIIVARATDGPLEGRSPDGPQQAFLRINRVQLDFHPKLA